MLNIGRMDRQIIIQRVTETRDSIGGLVETWSTLVSLWAQEIPVGGSEALRAGRTTATETSKFVSWYYAGITSKDRISYNSKIWNIVNLREIGLREGLEITAEVVQ